MIQNPLFSCFPEAGRGQTFPYALPCFSHFPPRKRSRKIMPRKISSPHIAIQTPLRPKVRARSQAAGSLTNHIDPRFMRQGISVSPAPKKTPYSTIEAQNNGSANA